MTRVSTRPEVHAETVRAPRPLVACGVAYSLPSITKRPGRQLLREVNLRLEPGEIVGLSGPSGSGKTTIVRMLSGLVAPDAGTVTLGDEPVGNVRKRSGLSTRGRIGVVFQSPRAAMDARMRLDRAISLAAEQAQHDGDSEPAPIIELAETLGLEPELLTRRPHEVSDGELQRAALLRTFAHLPEVVLCDEVTSALDSVSTAAVIGALQHFAHVRGHGVLIVSHDMSLLKASTDRLLTVAGNRVHDR